MLAALLAISASRECVADEIRLAGQGRAAAVIRVDAAVMAADVPQAGRRHEFDAEAQRQRLRESVRDLAHYLEKISGAQFDIAAVEMNVDGPAPAADDSRLPILIGRLAEDRFGPVGRTAPFRQAFRVVIQSDGVGLYGESDLATSYAIYELLHRLGCRWFMPSAMGEVIPRTADLKLAALDVAAAPATIYRGIWYADEAYKRRNRTGGLKIEAGHALEGYITPEQRKQRPDWVGTVDGVPQERRLRWSAPGLPEAIAEHIIGEIDKHPETLSWSLSPDDGLGYDNSAEDRAWDAGDFDPSSQTISITDRQVRLCNRIVELVTKKHPHVYFGMLAYGVSTRPPVREKVHPNLIPQIAPITYSRAHPMTDDGEPNNRDFRYLLEGWAKAAPNLSYYYYGFYLAEPAAPNPFMTKWGVNVAMAHKHNCAFWQPETISNFETAMHANYLGLRLAWDATQRPEDIYNEIHQQFYGPAAKEMDAYWRYIDSVWVETPEYSGCGFGHLRRFPPERVARARQLMDAALAKVGGRSADGAPPPGATPPAADDPQQAYRFRVGLADHSLQLFELFMKLRSDLADGRFAGLAAAAAAYHKLTTELGGLYADQYAFGRMGWTGPEGIYGIYFRAFYKAAYDEASRIARDFEILSPGVLRPWRYRYVGAGDAAVQDVARGDYEDSNWPTTDPGVDTWSKLGHHNDMGQMWYRLRTAVPAGAPEKKTYLWLASTDGTAQVFVNGRPIPYITPQGERKDVFSGFCQPAAFDVTEALRPGDANTIAILTERKFLNELGTGGLLGPVVLYRER